MGNQEFSKACIDMIVSYYKNKLHKEIKEEDVYVVWICKTLQNNKALLSTAIPDTRYIEITYNGDKNEFYLDVYVKEHNERIGGDSLSLQ